MRYYEFQSFRYKNELEERQERKIIKKSEIKKKIFLNLKYIKNIFNIVF